MSGVRDLEMVVAGPEMAVGNLLADRPITFLSEGIRVGPAGTPPPERARPMIGSDIIEHYRLARSPTRYG